MEEGRVCDSCGCDFVFVVLCFFVFVYFVVYGVFSRHARVTGGLSPRTTSAWGVRLQRGGFYLSASGFTFGIGARAIPFRGGWGGRCARGGRSDVRP